MTYLADSRPRSSRHLQFAARLILAALCLTVLFTAQEAMRRGTNGIPVDWSRAFAFNALDWVTWALLVPFVVTAGRRIRLDGAGNRAARTAAWVALGLSFCVAQGFITGMVLRLWGRQLLGPGGPVDPPLGRFLVNWTVSTSSLNILVFGMTAGVFHAALYYRDMRARQLREADLEGRLARAELNVLRMQVQPHFLFNALHTVSSLMVSDVPTAQRVVTALGDLLRASLDHTARQEIPLRDELAFIARYLDIQRARFRNRLTVDVEVPGEVLEALVPSLVLQPLVENAIRHGIEPSTRGGRIWIRAARNGNELALAVRDDGSVEGSAAAPAGGGIGLANIEARLAQLYGDAHAFRVGRDENGHFEVTVALPYHTDSGLFPAAAHVR